MFLSWLVYFQHDQEMDIATEGKCTYGNIILTLTSKAQFWWKTPSQTASLFSVDSLFSVALFQCTNRMGKAEE